ncbi:hypothetical protein EHRUM1_07500 [Ehrlichia ruminantium]|uniref:hypothetical protein n=1 Tax=Ehrlichia ruminantium TaxID=779 RepID=UPI0007C12B66|nr:hypothetical protein [Ehrlichia ruminantium]QLK52637.1 hypothetical protein FDZ65_03965 [Ehrlichia ruminantium]QLK54469.1 hypothetical protein FDZ63_03965 [Ehrlichia ruminantium]GAT76565.1 hypothetical protein EHRUM1_07500 [Ehrlichia ruminantium]
MELVEGIMLGLIVLFVVLIAVLLLYIFDCIGKGVSYKKQIDKKNDADSVTGKINSAGNIDTESLSEELPCTQLDSVVNVALLNESDQLFCDVEKITDRFYVNSCMIKFMQSAIEKLCNKAEFKEVTILQKVLSDVKRLNTRSREYLSYMMCGNYIVIEPLLNFEHVFYNKITQCIKKIRNVISNAEDDLSVYKCLNVLNLIDERCCKNNMRLVDIMNSVKNCDTDIGR